MNFAHYAGIPKMIHFFSSSYLCSQRHFWLFTKLECFMRQKQEMFLFGLDSEMFHVPFFPEQCPLGNVPEQDPQNHYDLPVNSHIPGHYDLPPVRRPPSPSPRRQAN